MKKIKLVVKDPLEYTTFTSWFLEPIWAKWFDVEYYNADVTYNNVDTVFAVKVKTDLNFCPTPDAWLLDKRDRGFKCVIDSLWDYFRFKHEENILPLQDFDFFLYNEPLWNRALNNDSYIPNKDYKKQALFVFNRNTERRNYFSSKLNKDLLLTNAFGQELPNDINRTVNGDWQRYMHSSWYDQTYFSIILESYSNDAGVSNYYTEKILKPLAFWHPFVVVGRPNVLSIIKQKGFATFDNLFDESYDQDAYYYSRCDRIIKTINEFIEHAYDSETLKRLEHNHYTFFDMNRALNGFEQYANKILDHVNSQ